MKWKREKSSELKIRNCRYRGRPARAMYVGGAMESASYREEGMRNELIFPYLRQISQAFSFRPEIRETLLIGGGGFAYPKYYLSHYPDRRIDVIEIRQDIIDAARSAFYLDELILKEGLNPDEVFENRTLKMKKADSKQPRLRVFCEDGMNYLLRSDRRYDLIINDAFDGDTANGMLGSEDGMRLVRAHLNPGGLYIINAAEAGSGLFSHRGKKLMSMLGRHFRMTAMIPCDEERPEWERQNYLIFASNEEL